MSWLDCWTPNRNSRTGATTVEIGVLTCEFDDEVLSGLLSQFGRDMQPIQARGSAKDIQNSNTRAE